MSAMSRVAANPGRVKEAPLWGYPIRFVFGGVITAVVGIIGTAYGPVVAGLFLAFPAILPAALTLISQEDGERAAGVDSFGAALGSMGLTAFGIVVWVLAPRMQGAAVLLIAMVVWAAVSMLGWLVMNKLRHPGLSIT